MKIGNIKFKNKIILAPMAGITFCCYRKLISKLGAAHTYTPLIPNLAIMANPQKLSNFDDVEKDEHSSIQIFGGQWQDYVFVAKLLDKKSYAKIIDINMGCPVRKVAIKSQSGSSLLKDVNKMQKIISEVKKVVKKPLTVKIRLGWDEKNYLQIVKAIEKAGVDAIAVHARTREQMFGGYADWEALREIKKHANIPIIGNGDIKTPEDAKKMLEYTGVDAIMIGRAAKSNPWIISQINQFLTKGFYQKEIEPSIVLKELKKMFDCLKRTKGLARAVLLIRTIIINWFKILKGKKELKSQVNTIKDQESFLKFCNELI